MLYSVLHASAFPENPRKSRADIKNLFISVLQSIDEMFGFAGLKISDQVFKICGGKIPPFLGLISDASFNFYDLEGFGGATR